MVVQVSFRAKMIAAIGAAERHCLRRLLTAFAITRGRLAINHVQAFRKTTTDRTLRTMNNQKANVRAVGLERIPVPLHDEQYSP
ncbi:hypothetical protein P9A28_gp45 [Sphingomonas phage Eidolon]|uniref:Uncharacterized protein n=1 Tax=Sphingomonas phage Eidolon TaxID=2686311 RepID=A0A6M3T9T8_9CAUD|nr:hypothetical protein P9A28_gp45 [Sphingomonas phage Eidolon]QJD54431.1 hypothetical protein [Sphingomonas phage Eidolon]